VRANGQKVLLAIKSMGGESSRRAVDGGEASLTMVAGAGIGTATYGL
jgi:hypothetical protein